MAQSIPDSVLKVIGFAMHVPPRRQFDQFSEETLQNLAEQIRHRFSDSGRLDFARSACQDLRKYGFQVPKDSDSEDITWYSDTECTEMLCDMDYNLYTEEMVQEALDFIDSCLHAQTPQPAQPAH